MGKTIASYILAALSGMCFITGLNLLTTEPRGGRAYV